MSLQDLGTTGSRSKVLHIPAPEPRRWSALCHRRGGQRFLIVIGEAGSMISAFPDRQLCKQCKRAHGEDE